MFQIQAEFIKRLLVYDDMFAQVEKIKKSFRLGRLSDAPRSDFGKLVSIVEIITQSMVPEQTKRIRDCRCFVCRSRGKGHGHVGKHAVLMEYVLHAQVGRC